jgi:hypothetical protein
MVDASVTCLTGRQEVEVVDVARPDRERRLTAVVPVVVDLARVEAVLAGHALSS